MKTVYQWSIVLEAACCCYGPNGWLRSIKTGCSKVNCKPTIIYSSSLYTMLHWGRCETPAVKCLKCRVVTSRPHHSLSIYLKLVRIVFPGSKASNGLRVLQLLWKADRSCQTSFIIERTKPTSNFSSCHPTHSHVIMSLLLWLKKPESLQLQVLMSWDIMTVATTLLKHGILSGPSS